MSLVLIYAQITSGESSGNNHVIKVYETRNSYVLCALKLLNPFTRYNRLSNRLYNGFDNRLNVCIHNTTGCQTGLTTGCIVTTGLTIGCIV